MTATRCTGSPEQTASSRTARSESPDEEHLDADLRQVRRRAVRARLRHHHRQLAAAHPAVVAVGRGDHGRADRRRPARVLDPARRHRGRHRHRPQPEGSRAQAARRALATAPPRQEGRAQRHAPATFTRADGVEILNPEQHIATLVEGRQARDGADRQARPRLRVGRAQQGRGRCRSAPSRSTRIFSPVRKVNFTVTNARVGQRTDYDADASRSGPTAACSPEDAVAYAARILQDQLAIFINFEEDDGDRRAARGGDREPAQREPLPPGRRARALGALGELPAERRHQVHRRAGAADRAGDAQDQELRPQVAERDQGDPAEMGLELGMKLENWPGPQRRSRSRNGSSESTATADDETLHAPSQFRPQLGRKSPHRTRHVQQHGHLAADPRPHRDDRGKGQGAPRLTPKPPSRWASTSSPAAPRATRPSAAEKASISPRAPPGPPVGQDAGRDGAPVRTRSVRTSLVRARVATRACSRPASARATRLRWRSSSSSACNGQATA